MTSMSGEQMTPEELIDEIKEQMDKGAETAGLVIGFGEDHLGPATNFVWDWDTDPLAKLLKCLDRGGVVYGIIVVGPDNVKIGPTPEWEDVEWVEAELIGILASSNRWMKNVGMATGPIKNVG